MEKELKAIDKHPLLSQALAILLTPDGKGRVKKGKILSELCCCVNPNWTRDAIEEYIKDNP